MSNKLYDKRNLGFTLAEVLVTLAIIGVVAALTIPSLMQKTQDDKNLVSWKKQYSVITQAVKQLEAQNESIDMSSQSALRTDLGTVMSFISTDTWANLSGKFYYYYKNTTDGTDSSTWTDSSAISADGSIWRFLPYAGGACANTSGTLTGICAQIYVDVNGLKPPNMYGKDLHALWIVKNNGTYIVYPQGLNDTRICTSGSVANWTSLGCSRLALIQSAAQMP